MTSEDYHRLKTPPRMAMRLDVLFLLLLSINWTHANENGFQASEGFISKEVEKKNENLCTLCEHFAAQALDYITKNKTQEEVIENRHHACAKLHHLNEQCILLVDYYAPLFFLEIELLQLEDFCTKKKITPHNQSYILSLHSLSKDRHQSQSSPHPPRLTMVK